MSIESTWTSQGFIEGFWEIGSGNNNNSLSLLETVELDKKLIEGLFHVVLIRQLLLRLARRGYLLDP